MPGLTPQNWGEFRELPLYFVQRKHIDPSLEGDRSDTEHVALFRGRADAEAFAQQCEKNDPDSWNAYSVQGPLPLSSIVSRLSLSQDSIRRILTALRGSPGGPIPI